MHPAIAFCEAVCKRASADGWKLYRNRVTFIWKNGNEQISGQFTEVGPRRQLHNACVALDAARYNLSVELT